MLPWRNCRNHYFQIDQILATQEKVPSTFLKTVKHVECLDPSSDGEVKKGAVIDIPYWLARTLSRANVSIVKMQLPKIYKDVYRDILNADASVVDLYKMSKFFYLFGKRVCSINDANSSELRSLLNETFKDRFRQLMDWVQNMGVDEIVTEKLDSLERQLLMDGREAQKRLNGWLNYRVENVQAADMVINHTKKRKFAAIEA